jgi:hypothetical protein
VKRSSAVTIVRMQAGMILALVRLGLGTLAALGYPLTLRSKSCSTGGEARSRRGLAVMAVRKRQKLSNQRRRASPAPVSKETDPAPIRAAAPLVEQYYVAVDRQVKSGFGTFEAAQRAAKEIKKRFPNRQVTVFDAKERSYTAIE